MTVKSMKRIHTVTIERMRDDENGADSIGTFDMEAKSPFAIKLDEPCYGYRYEGYTFYNGPVENYEGVPDEEIREYVKQDYERMKTYNAGEWDYIGIRAVASVQVEQHGPFQEVVSGGLWGIESDSDVTYIQSVEDEELSTLRAQLHAIGFSQRAITAAFQTIVHKDV